LHSRFSRRRRPAKSAKGLGRLWNQNNSRTALTPVAVDRLISEVALSELLGCFRYRIGCAVSVSRAEYRERVPLELGSCAAGVSSPFPRGRQDAWDLSGVTADGEPRRT
jgi:hypothetical protein